MKSEDIEEFLPTNVEVGINPDTIKKLQDELVFTEGVTSKKPLSLVERSICELRADKKTNTDIANYLGLTITEVKRVLARDHVKFFLQELINAQYEISKEYRLELINKIISAKVKKIEEGEEDVDFASATKKDLVDLLLIQDSMLKEREKKELGTNEDTYVTLLQQIIK